MSGDLEDRIAELETRASRIIPATSGSDGWINYIQSSILEERKFSHDVVAHALALMRNEIMGEVKAIVTEALTQRIRGTYTPGEKYRALDTVVSDGASFVARRDNPGKLPGDGW